MNRSSGWFVRRVRKSGPTLAALVVLAATVQYFYQGSPPSVDRVTNSWPEFAYATGSRIRLDFGYEIFASKPQNGGSRLVASTGGPVEVDGRLTKLLPIRALSEPRLSPDGTRLVFQGVAAGADGRKAMGVIVAEVSQPRLEPDDMSGNAAQFAKMIAKLRSQETGIPGCQGHLESAPQWSPTHVLGQGERIAYSDWAQTLDCSEGESSRDLVIYLVSPDGSKSCQLVPDSPKNNSYVNVCWSRDSKRIAATGAYQVDHGPVSRFFLMKLKLAGTSGKLAAEFEADLAPMGSPIHGKAAKHPIWAKRADKVAVCVLGPEGWDIWVVEPFVSPGGIPRTTRITDTSSFAECLPMWSPDDALVYYRQQSNDHEGSTEGFGCAKADGTGSSRSVVAPFAGFGKNM